MLRKTLIAVAAAGAMALGIGATTTPAAAYHHGGFHIYIGTPLIIGHHGRKHWHCHWIKVKKYGHWKKVKSCHKHWHKHPHHI